MAKSLRREDAIALGNLRDRLELTIRFMSEAQDFPNAAQVLDMVYSAASKHDLRTLRLIAREVDAMTIALTSDQRDGLEALLRSRLGVDKEAERQEQRRWAQRVLQRGTISSEKERRRLEDYAEMLEALGEDPAHIDAVRRLLASA